MFLILNGAISKHGESGIDINWERSGPNKIIMNQVGMKGK